MPVKLNIGLSRKVGEANYGSRGASVNLEVELESGIVGDPPRFKERVQSLYGLARRSVEDELDLTSGQAAAKPPARNGAGTPMGQQRGTAPQSQVRAISAIARRCRLDPKSLARERFGLTCLEGLSIRDASSLIDDLKRRVSEVGI